MTTDEIIDSAKSSYYKQWSIDKPKDWSLLQTHFTLKYFHDKFEENRIFMNDQFFHTLLMTSWHKLFQYFTQSCFLQHSTSEIKCVRNAFLEDILPYLYPLGKHGAVWQLFEIFVRGLCTNVHTLYKGYYTQTKLRLHHSKHLVT